ncbi:hypothetical protein L1987_81723 [Smallanthus sonchifolius]|uniref:Uncharacterized protein n=1 Tax=Smallanthus sonchifolius TaxID=185202 RepID=A0ACB8YRW0_9ASTR|nr:hypothetical protein L1987_81723 [Smallanthus sonchifolius]
MCFHGTVDTINDGIKCPSMKKESMISSIRILNMTSMRLREEAELQSRGFGLGELVNKDEEEPATEDVNIVS